MRHELTHGPGSRAKKQSKSSKNPQQMRNYKPERSSREELFVPGVDPGLKEWLVVRQAGRDAQARGSRTRIITCDMGYKLKQFWRDQLILYHQQQHGGHNQGKDESISLAQFEQMLKARCSFEDIVTAAMKKRNNTFIDMALAHGVDIDYRMGYSRRTMLHTACRDGDLTKVLYLIELGADLNTVDAKGSTPLHLAMQPPSTFHPLEIVTSLIECGCKVNIADKHGHTPLHLACIVGSKELMELLLKNRALPFVLDKKGKLPIDYTRLQLNRQFCQYLAAHSVKTQQEKVWARIIARNVVTSILRATTPSCDICMRTLSECQTLKTTKYRYWLFAHHRLNKEVYEDRVREESRASAAQLDD